LLEAAGHNDAGLVKRLLDNKAAITAKNNNNKTAFMLAAKKGHDEVIKILLDYLQQSSIDVNEILSDQDVSYNC